MKSRKVLWSRIEG